MAFKFPFTNYHELNLTWVLEQLKKLFEESEENVETIEGYEDRLSAVETELPTVEATADQAAQTANAAATLAQTAKSTADTANENALAASAQAGLARQEAAAAESEAQAATQAAQQAQATAQNFDGRITQAEADASEALQEAQSFENRVNAAINTANNAANTATIAQGIAVNANQNAATALDTAQAADTKADASQDTADQNAANIGNLSDLTTTAKNNLVAAINEAAHTGGEGTDDTKAPLIVSSASGAIASFSDGADNMQIQKLVCIIEATQDGTGEASPTNIRPLSGHNGMTLKKTGTNLFDDSIRTELEGGYVRFNTNGLLSNKTVTLPPGTYTFAYTLASTFTTLAHIRVINTDTETSVAVQYNALQITFTLEKITNILFQLQQSGLTSADVLTAQLAPGSTASNYETYNGTSIPIIWQTEAGIIYSGTIDILSGKLVVDKVFWTKNTATMNNDENFPGWRNAGIRDLIGSGIDRVFYNQVLNVGKAFAVNSTYDILYLPKGVGVQLYDMTQTEWVAMAIDVQILIPLATPIEYTLTANELTTLYGQNNVWTDVGAIQSCKYPADTKLYIDGKVAELQALILEN